jgi:hypothetical protein
LASIPAYLLFSVFYWVRELLDGFDRRYGTDTSARVDPHDLGVSHEHLAHSSPYQATRLKHLNRWLQLLPIDHRDYTFIDMGSGKGRVMLGASDLPFRRIVGVEFSPPLCEIARRNIEIYRSPTQQCRSLQVECADAAAFALPPENLVIYFYYPFGRELMARVVSNLGRSLEESPRDVYVIYNWAENRQLFDEAPFLERFADRSKHSSRTMIYRSRVKERPPAPAPSAAAPGSR